MEDHMAGWERRRQEFLSKANEAENLAVKTTDAVARACWLKIADGYRELARQQAR